MMYTNYTTLKHHYPVLLLVKYIHRLPQVLWRYKGKKPAKLGANTQLFDWLPQNDLLGKTKWKKGYIVIEGQVD